VNSDCNEFAVVSRISSIETSQLIKGNRILYESHGRQQHKCVSVGVISRNTAFIHVSVCVQEYFFPFLDD
jgi:hypothetical protein